MSTHTWNQGFKFSNRVSRELARKNTRLLHYLTGFWELDMGFITAWSLWEVQVDSEATWRRPRGALVNAP